ncbi:MAG: SDR family NAD(P)-dependent oxidoreductase [Frankia sp.]
MTAPVAPGPVPPRPVAPGPVRIGADLVEDFRAASRDENPLHVDPGYARGTSFGEPVVYGVLGALTALARLTPRPGQVPGRLAVRFPGPILRDRDYRCEVAADDPGGSRRAEVRLLYGAQPALAVTVDFVPGTPDPELPPEAPSTARTTARAAGLADLHDGDPLPAGYQPRWPALAGLVDRLGLTARGFGPQQVAVLAWASYLAGMEAPGRASLLADITVDYRPGDGAGRFEARATIDRVHPRLRMLKLAGTVRSPALAATATVRVFHRPDVDASDVARLRELVRKDGADAPAGARADGAPSGPGPLAGTTALVVGASRGLGAALTQALALAGAVVYAGFHRSSADAQTMRAALGDDAGRVHLVAGDAADPAWCRRVRDRILSERGGLDVLILNACPPPTKVPLADGSDGIAAAYIGTALGLVQTPLTVFAEPVARAGGSVVGVSTRWVAEPEAGWFPYVAAKTAAEGLVRAAAAEHRQARWAVLRPGRLRTAFNATPMTAEIGEPVEPAAAAVVAHLTRPRAAGTFHVID